MTEAAIDPRVKALWDEVLGNMENSGDQQDDEMSITDLAESYGASKETIRKKIYKLVEEGKVEWRWGRRSIDGARSKLYKVK